jgi:hypothetical protein
LREIKADLLANHKQLYHPGIKTIAVLKTEIFRFILVSACFLSLWGDRYGMVS